MHYFDWCLDVVCHRTVGLAENNSTTANNVTSSSRNGGSDDWNKIESAKINKGNTSRESGGSRVIKNESVSLTIEPGVSSEKKEK